MVLAIVELQEILHYLASTVRSFVVILRILSLVAPRLVVPRLVVPLLVALRPFAQFLVAPRLVIPRLVPLLLVALRLIVPRLVAPRLVVPRLVALLLVAPRLVVPPLVALLKLLVAPVHPHKDHLRYGQTCYIQFSVTALGDLIITINFILLYKLGMR